MAQIVDQLPRKPEALSSTQDHQKQTNKQTKQNRKYIVYIFGKVDYNLQSRLCS
jgi:hypothetical protein